MKQLHNYNHSFLQFNLVGNWQIPSKNAINGYATAPQPKRVFGKNSWISYLGYVSVCCKESAYFTNWGNVISSLGTDTIICYYYFVQHSYFEWIKRLMLHVIKIWTLFDFGFLKLQCNADDSSHCTILLFSSLLYKSYIQMK